LHALRQPEVSTRVPASCRARRGSWQHAPVKHFLDDRSTLVSEAVDAAVILGGGKLARLDGHPSIKVVLRAGWDRGQVAVVSGGGSGHEPAHAGFVGDGLLTAAVCGEIFASPSVDAVLAGILAVTGKAGCLLIVKNYTGDRLNFGLAAERARALGLEVATVLVGDDVAIEGSARPRGVAGTLFVHKVAGHLARAGAPLAEVTAAAERVASTTRTLGLALTTCSIPGHPLDERIGASEVELGLGIHGEPGAEKLPLRPVRELAALVMERLERSLPTSDGPVAMLVNDLGGVPALEMAAVTRALLLAARRPVELLFGPARAMTALDMKGFSVSLLPLDDPRTREALLAPVEPAAWPAGRVPTEVAPLPLPDALRRAPPAPSTHAERRRVVEVICKALVALQGDLDALDAKVGDGDAGTTIAAGARSTLAMADELPFADAPALCQAISARLGTVMGGSSGILLSIFFAAVGAALAEREDWAAALSRGAARVGEYGGAQAGHRTMLDALLPAVAALAEGADLGGAAAAARAGAERTATMAAGAGRSAYVRAEALAGVPDPGAVAVAAAFAAAASADGGTGGGVATS
jgi:dihydroxyacetone kinase